MLFLGIVAILLVLQSSNGINLFAKRDSSANSILDVAGDTFAMEETTGAAATGGCSTLSDAASENRIIAIGDVHGSYDGLLEDLFAANVTKSITSCEWKHQETPTVLVQMGDMVDRGAGALEALECLRHLQSTASQHNAEVVRLLGNHELWWLTGIFFQRNKADTEERIIKFLKLLWDDILTRKIVGSYVHYVNHRPIMFVHAGYTDNFVKYLKLDSAEEIANYTNNHLVNSVSQCTRLPCPSITKHELYEAGPSRGGNGIGGPYWTDFTTLLEEDGLRSRTKGLTKSFLQVVGHTMAFCYDPRAPGKHPPDHVAECGLGLIRASSSLQSVCVDAGMYAGGRGFLEITKNGRYLSHERRGDLGTTPWKTKDLSLEMCGI